MSKNLRWDRAKKANKKEKARMEPEFPTLPVGSNDCWCGEKAGHDWPGKEDGEPHPR